MKARDEDSGSIFSIFGGLDRIINVVSDMVENDKKEVNVSGGINSDNEKKITGKYAFNIKLGPESIAAADKIKKFNDLFDKKGEVPKTIEPVTDIFEEENGVTIVSELPGIGKDDIELSISGNTVTLSAAKNGIGYLKKIVLKFVPDPGSLKESFNNSIYSVFLKGRL